MVDSEKIKTGDLIFCEGHSWYSSIIKFVTRSKITHVGIAIWVDILGHKELCALEPHMGKGVALRPLVKIISHDYPKGSVYWASLIGINGDEVAKYALEVWADPYASIYQFLVIGSRIIKYLRKVFGKSLDTDNTRTHCSELAARSLIRAGYVCSQEPALLSPVDVSNFYCVGPLRLINVVDSEIRIVDGT